MWALMIHSWTPTSLVVPLGSGEASTVGSTTTSRCSAWVSMSFADFRVFVRTFRRRVARSALDGSSSQLVGRKKPIFFRGQPTTTFKIYNYSASVVALERWSIFKIWKKYFCFQNALGYSCFVHLYSAGVVNCGRRIGSWNNPTTSIYNFQTLHLKHRS
jgi:hypothetical protein